jgi:hypothetical protein
MPRPKKATTPAVNAPKPVRKRPVKAKPAESAVAVVPPPVQEVIVSPAPSKWKSIFDSAASFAVLACACAFLGMAAGYAWNRTQGDVKPVDPVVIVDEGPEGAAKLFVEQYRSNLAKVYEDASKQAFKDLGESRDFITPRRNAATEQAFKPMADQLESINGNKWDAAKAKSMFEGFAKGLVKP